MPPAHQPPHKTSTVRATNSSIPSPLSQRRGLTSSSARSKKDFDQYIGRSSQRSVKGFIENDVFEEDNPMIPSSASREMHHRTAGPAPSRLSRVGTSSTLSQGGYGMLNSGYGMGSYGMGMGYGGYNPYGAYGMGMGGYGTMMNGQGLMGPLAALQNLNFFFMNIYQMAVMVGMNSNALLQTLNNVSVMLRQLEQAVRQSKFRVFLQRKSKKSKLLRFVFVFTAMALASQGVRLLKNVLVQMIGNYWKSSSQIPIAAATSPSVPTSSV